MAYINIKTNEFPLFIGDIPLYEIDWTEDQPIPDYFEEVEIDPVPVVADDETYESIPPFKYNGKWVQKHFTRKLTEEELNLSKLRKEQELAKIKEMGIPIPTQTVVLDDNNNVIIDQYGNLVPPVEEPVND